MPAVSNTSKNAHYAKFATTSRLIACLVSESLVKAVYIPCNEPGIQGLCLLLRPQRQAITGLDDLLAVVPLSGVPILNETPLLVQGVKGAHVILVDGWDMLPHIYSPMAVTLVDNVTFPPVANAESTTQAVAKTLSSLLLVPVGVHQLADGFDAVQLWTQFASDFGVNEKLSQLIAQELDSSMLNQGKKKAR